MATLGEPVGAAALAWVWFDEAIPPAVLLGCAITVIAVAFALGRRDRAPR